jgi:hypothetical protein
MIADVPHPLKRICNIESLLEDEPLFEEILRRAYEKHVVFNNLLRAISSELRVRLGSGDPFLDGAISSILLVHPFREKFFATLTKVAQS